MAPDLISLRLPFNGGLGGGQIVEHRTGKSRGRGLPRGAPHGRCGGVEAWRSGRGTQCGAECLSVACRGRVRACGRGLSGISGMAAVPANPCQACQAWQAMTSFFWWTVELRHNVQSSVPPGHLLACVNRQGFLGKSDISKSIY